MQVMLVKPIITTSEGAENRPRPKVGDIDTVIDERKIDNTLYYLLERFGNELGFIASHFAILPDTSTDEMQEEEKEAIVNLQPA
jgi:hypothetical protein